MQGAGGEETGPEISMKEKGRGAQQVGCVCVLGILSEWLQHGGTLSQTMGVSIPGLFLYSLREIEFFITKDCGEIYLTRALMLLLLNL